MFLFEFHLFYFELTLLLKCFGFFFWCCYFEQLSSIVWFLPEGNQHFDF